MRYKLILLVHKDKCCYYSSSMLIQSPIVYIIVWEIQSFGTQRQVSLKVIVVYAILQSNVFLATEIHCSCVTKPKNREQLLPAYHAIVFGNLCYITNISQEKA